MGNRARPSTRPAGPAEIAAPPGQDNRCGAKILRSGAQPGQQLLDGPTRPRAPEARRDVRERDQHKIPHLQTRMGQCRGALLGMVPIGEEVEIERPRRIFPFPPPSERGFNRMKSLQELGWRGRCPQSRDRIDERRIRRLRPGGEAIQVRPAFHPEMNV
jgi:hypothetical protein